MTEPMIAPLFAEYTIAKRNVVITSDMPSVTFLIGLPVGYADDFLRKMTLGLIQIRDKDGIELKVRTQ
jgi:hypothetical protein